MPPTLPSLPSPATSGTLRAIVNANQALHSYDSNLGPAENIITDCNRDTDLSDGTTFQQTLDYLAGKFTSPTLPAGSYLSAFVPTVSPVDPDMISGDPITRLDGSLFSPGEILIPSSTAPFIDFITTVTRNKLTGLIVDEAQSRLDDHGLQWLFTDNWTWNPEADAVDTSPFPATWDQVLTYMEELTAALHAIGVRHVPNFHFRVGHPDLVNADYQQLAAACDVVTFERAVDSVAIDTGGHIALMLQAYQAFIAAGGIPILLPQFYQALTGTTRQEKDLAEESMLAGVAMLVGSPAMVCSAFHYPRQTWFSWPTTFGSPTGPVEQNGRTASRAFGTWRITVNFATHQTSIGVNMATDAENLATIKSNILAAIAAQGSYVPFYSIDGQMVDRRTLFDDLAKLNAMIVAESPIELTTEGY